MPGLNVVALISGGKDSFFSILHCQANGHNVVALANLHPPRTEQNGAVDDLESYMYQTIGHAVIPLYEQVLGLPLYRQEISGAAVNHDKSYGIGSEALEDETESLLPLLRKVIAAHPEVNAVSTGAILSDYQRTRVESVALRIGLTPLSYLWQWPVLPPHTQSSLLEDMASVGQDARIVKVASGGLDDSFLWQNVADRRTIARLTKAAERFGAPGDGAVLGEGGEYETLAIGGPGPLWKGKIVVPDRGIQTTPGQAGSASVRISHPTVSMNADAKETFVVRKPPLLEDRFENILKTTVSEDLRDTDQSPVPQDLDTASPVGQNLDDAISVPNVVGKGATAAEQTRSIMNEILVQLSARSQGPGDIAYSTIVLRDMGDFGAVNTVYGSYFAKPNPPARATIACADALPAGALLSISVTSSGHPRDGLHVQSRSYWAPANIGPYSQAVRFGQGGLTSLRGSVLIAGQIPLVPASMELPSARDSSTAEGFAQQSVLALQHLERIGRVMKVKQWLHGVALIAKSTLDITDLRRKASTVRHAWKMFHSPVALDPAPDSDSEAEDFDVWHLNHGAGRPKWHQQSFAPEPTDSNSSFEPPLVVIAVDTLPRNADVEWIGYGKTVKNNDFDVPIHLRSLLDAFQDLILP